MVIVLPRPGVVCLRGQLNSNVRQHYTEVYLIASRNSVFVSYAHRDKRHLDRLLVHLAPLRRIGRAIDVWSDRRIAAGDKWEEEINLALRSSSIAILLVSADFLASQFIMQREWPEILRKSKTGRLKVLPVVLGHCGFALDKPLGAFHAVNDPTRPIESLPVAERERAWLRVRQAVEACAAGEPPDQGWRVVNEQRIFESLVILSKWTTTNGFVILSSGDAYVQFLRDLDAPGFFYEAISNEYLPAERKLSEREIRKLKTLGFQLDRTGSTNYSQYVRHETQPARIRAVAKHAVRTLVGVYGVSKNEDIRLSGGIMRKPRASAA